MRKKKLEAAIHQYKGDIENSRKWLKRLGKSINDKFINKLQFGEFIYFDGSRIEILPNTTRVLSNFKDGN